MGVMLNNRAMAQTPPPPPTAPRVSTVLTMTPEEAQRDKESFYEMLKQGQRAEQVPETKAEAEAAIRRELARPRGMTAEAMAGLPEKRGYAGREEIKPIPGTPKAGPISDYPTLINTISRGVQYGLGRMPTSEEAGRKGYQTPPKVDPEALKTPPPRETAAWIERRQPSARRRK
jgi:hypothetical protein